jgi:pilus assembly protein FimV
LETSARQLQDLTGGVGDDWLKAQELGRQVDPDNPLYLDISQTGAVDIDTSPEPPSDLAPATAEVGYGADEPAVSAYAGSAAPSRASSRNQIPDGVDSQPADSGVDFDLDIDLGSVPHLSGLEATRPISVMSTSTGEFGSSSAFNFNTESLTELGNVELGATDLGGLELEETGMRPLPDLDLGLDDHAGSASHADNSLDFDFSGLSLDLDKTPSQGGLNTSEGAGNYMSFEAPASSFDLDPLERKIELAEEFRRIGDAEGARDLLEEVLNQGSGEMRARAQAILDELG